MSGCAIRSSANGYPLKGDGCLKGPDYTVTWAVGHLVTLCEPDEIDEKYKKVGKYSSPYLRLIFIHANYPV